MIKSEILKNEKDFHCEGCGKLVSVNKQYHSIHFNSKSLKLCLGCTEDLVYFLKANKV